jgi:hypothetical protein
MIIIVNSSENQSYGISNGNSYHVCRAFPPQKNRTEFHDKYYKLDSLPLEQSLDEHPLPLPLTLGQSLDPH